MITLIKKKKFIKYMIFSALTSLINILVYFFVSHYISKNILISNIFAYACSIIASFIINKKIVFKNKKNKYIKQLSLYLCIKIISLSLDSYILILLYKNLNVNHFISKLLSNASTGLLNYVLNNKVIFKSKEVYKTPI